MQQCDPNELEARRSEVQVVDVREPEEWAAGRIEDSAHIPMGELPGRLDELANDRAIVLVCRSGARSGQVTVWLAAQGYDATNLRGGLEAWRAAGLALSTPDGRPGTV